MGSEMCIRDRLRIAPGAKGRPEVFGYQPRRHSYIAETPPKMVPGAEIGKKSIFDLPPWVSRGAVWAQIPLTCSMGCSPGLVSTALCDPGKGLQWRGQFCKVRTRNSESGRSLRLTPSLNCAHLISTQRPAVTNGLASFGQPASGSYVRCFLPGSAAASSRSAWQHR